jgi:periplasmic protein TonB
MTGKGAAITAASFVVALALHVIVALLPLPPPFTTGATAVSSSPSLEITFAAQETVPENEAAAERDLAPVKVESEPRETVQDILARSNGPVERREKSETTPQVRRDVSAAERKKIVDKAAPVAAPSKRPEQVTGRTEPTGRSADAPVVRANDKPVVPAAPRYRDNPPPDYPREARRRGHEGLVMLSVNVGVDGKAHAVEVQETSGFDLLDRAALRAVREWRFDPATRGGTPIEMTVEVPVRFELRDDSW